MYKPCFCVIFPHTRVGEPPINAAHTDVVDVSSTPTNNVQQLVHSAPSGFPAKKHRR